MTGSDLIRREDIVYHTQLEPMGNGQYEDVEVAYRSDIDALPSAEYSKLLQTALNGDLISRADAIEAVARLCLDGQTAKVDGYFIPIQDALINTLNALPSAEAKTKCIAQIKVDTEEIVRRIKEEYDITDGWIPVSERLPSESGRYLVAYHLFTPKNKWIDIMYFGKPSMPNIKVKGECWYRVDDEWGDVVYNDILAWMPVPRPYEGSESDEID